MGFWDQFNPWSGGSNPFEKTKAAVTTGAGTPWGTEENRGGSDGMGLGLGGPSQNTWDALFKGKNTPIGAGNEKGYSGVGNILGLIQAPGMNKIWEMGADNETIMKGANRWGGTVNRTLGLDDGAGGAAPKYENPYENLPAFDPSAYAKFDTSEMAKTMQRDNAVRGARDQANAVAQMNQYGTLGSGQMASAQGNLAAEGERAQQGISAQLARMSYDDALKQWMLERNRLSSAVAERNKQKKAEHDERLAQEQADTAALGNVAGLVGKYFTGGM